MVKTSHISLDNAKPVGLNQWVLGSKKKTEIDVRPVSLDKWVVKPVTLDAWKLGSHLKTPNRPKAKPKVITLKEIDLATSHDLPHDLEFEKSKTSPVVLQTQDLKTDFSQKPEPENIEKTEDPIISWESEEQPLFVETESQLEQESAPPIQVDAPLEEIEEERSQTQNENIDLVEPPLEETKPEVEDQIASSSSDIVELKDSDLKENNQFEVIKLTKQDLALEHQFVTRLYQKDLLEYQSLEALRLRTIDLAINHRVVFELSEEYFDHFEIERDQNGVILLSNEDLVEKEQPKPRKNRSRSNKQHHSDDKIVKYTLIAILVMLLLLPFTMHFKYAWITVTEQQYSYMEEEADTFKSLEMKFQYRTPNSSFRWYGRQLLNSDAYQEAEKDFGFFTWMFFSNSKKVHIGDTYP